MEPNYLLSTRWPAPLRAALAVLCTLTLVTSALPAWAQQTPAKGSAPGDTDKPLIAVLDMEAVGASAAQASALTDRLREELLNSDRYTLVDRSQMKSILNEQALQQSGCTSTECAVQVGQILGVRKIVTSKLIQAQAGLWLLSAQMTDVETAQTLAAVSVQYQGDYAGVLSQGITMLGAKLTGQAPPVENMVKTAPASSPQPAEQAAVKPKAQEESSSSGWWWALAGVAVVGAAAAASHKSSSPSSSSSSSGGGGGVTVTW